METKGKSASLGDRLGMGDLKSAAGDYASSLVSSSLGKVGDKVDGLTDRLTDFSEGTTSGPSIKQQAVAGGIKSKITGENTAMGAIGGALSGVKDKVKETLTGGKKRGSGKFKFANFVETLDVGVPVRVAYNQWTEFEQWSDFMKKVESVQYQEEEGKVDFKGKVFLSHRTWESSIKEMVPDDRIIWKSKGQKGHFDGAVTFHEVAPRLTRIVVVIEYYPQGLIEKTANIWRAVGRRLRLELKLYIRHVMTNTIRNPDDVEGWRGEIRDGKVIRTHEEALEEERQAEEEAQREDEAPEDEYDDESEDEYDESEDEYDDEEPADEYDDESEDEPAGEYDEEEPEASVGHPAHASRRGGR
jgi:uncharacterized membrane protein